MRILLAHSFYRIPGGEDRHVRAQVQLLSGSHPVRLISEKNVDLSESPAVAARMLYSPAKKHDVGAMIEEFRPDVIHIHNVYPSLGPAVQLAANKRGIPVVMTVHNFRLRCPNSFMFTEDAVCRRCQDGLYFNAVMHKCFPTAKQSVAYATILWIHRFLGRLEHGIAKFIVPSDFMLRRLVDEWGIADERVRMVRHFVEPQSSTDRSQIGSYGLFLGRMSAEKGVDVLLRALRRAGDPPFILAGDGPVRDELETLARELQLQNTRFLGWCPRAEAERLVAEARYVAVPSVWEETANLAALEALAAGRPLLVSNRGALPELVATGAGLACRPGDEFDTSRQIKRLAQDDDICRRSSAEAIRVADDRLTPSRHLSDLADVYREVIR